ncbi:hypothetical protein IV203_020624 [Nitzschia inconspicua]|uniref:G-protein coupled receptors family 2 profile 2 domain-containing protein n=1 Tax=Nitzschia inconspicua TaxID=303405 RepID=A0A9K3KFL1_9STRA|nr:hypothetical protein IV203_020624 [Nitzschia inconspicua]
MSWTPTQQAAIAIAPKVSGMLSIIGSCCIVYDIVCFQLRRQDGVPTVITSPETPPQKTSCCSILSFCSNISCARINNSISKSTSKFTSILATSTSHHRIILGMSISDCIISCAHFFSSWPIPADADSEFSIYGNIGNTMTCSAQGFFIQLGIMVPLYNSLLVLYFVLTIRRGWTEADFQQYAGPIGHTLIWIFGLGTAVAGLFLNLYNNANLWCWIASYPQDCVQTFQPPVDESDYLFDAIDGSTKEPCDRGDNSFIYRFAFWYGPLWLMFPWVVLGMTLVYLHVLKQDKKMESYLIDYTEKVTDMHEKAKQMEAQHRRMSKHAEESRPDKDDDTSLPAEPSMTDLSTGDISERERMDSSQSHPNSTTVHDQAIQTCNELKRTARVRSNAVALQGIFYMLAFLASYMFSTVVRSMQLAEKQPHWSLFFMFALLKPLQGLMNGFVYFRPRFFPVPKNRPNISAPMSA